jgi:NAD(P)-dependent dehydrogenase (short-subunit alcohol dehydrogenase family)
MTAPTCTIVGVGPGNGAAFAQRFAAGGYRVACLARSQDYLRQLTDTLPHGVPVPCDASDPSSVDTAIRTVHADGTTDVLVYNAGSGVFGSVDDVSPEDLDRAWRLNTLGLHAAARAVAPAMIDAGSGTIVVVGATASLRGGAKFAAFAQAKAAQRSLAQSMARHWGSRGIHVGLLIIDGVVDTPKRSSVMPDHPEDRLMKPSAIAEAAWTLAHQDRSAWTFEMDLRPSAEPW